MPKLWRILAILLCGFPSGASAGTDSLPENLTLQCMGSLKSMKFYPVRDKSPVFENGDFVITIQLKNKSMFDLTNDRVLGKNCILEKGEIGCGFDETSYVARHDLTERNQGIVLITRDTGALRLLHSTWVYGGKTATGKPSATEKLERTGTCKTIKRDPLF